MDYESAHRNIEELENFYRTQGVTNRNEATTRLQLVDRLLFECLGWDKADCIPEESQDKEYTDYTLHAPHRALIVEAKKEGIYFELPLGMAKPIYDISFFQKSHPTVHAAIEQAIGYCLKRGTTLGCVSNGYQLVAFLGSRTDGIAPLEGKALVFDSLEAMRDRSLQLWQNLSKPGTQALQLAVTLREGSASSPPAKLSSRLSATAYPGYKNRNDLQNELLILGDIIIEDLVKNFDQVEFLKECYCGSGALSQYALLNKKILENRYSTLFEQTAGAPTLSPLVTKSGVNQQALAESLTNRPILLLGDVGVGKTIFIKHLINIDVAELIANALVFYVDFGVNPTLGSELHPYMTSEMECQMYEKHGFDMLDSGFIRGVYQGDLARFKRGLHSHLLETDPNEFRRKEVEYLLEKTSDKDSHLKASLVHLSKSRHKQNIIILDNIDQRPHEFQQAVFLMGQSLAETWSATVYISIRPETFYKSKISGTMSAYHSRAFTIAPPRLEEVIHRRFEYAIRLLKSGRVPGVQSISANLQTIVRYLEVMLRSFKKDDSLVEFIDNLSGGNVRLALDLIRTFIGSGHVDATKIVYTKGYKVPLHEFLGAVMLGANRRYHPATSELINVFDISSFDGREHFLTLILLAQIDRWGQAQASDGYTPHLTLVEFAQNCGFQVSQTKYALDRLLKRKLIETNTKVSDESASYSLSYRITSVGAFYHMRLISMFAYVDPLVIDTPIIDPEVRSKMADVDALDQRLERAKIFYNYLAVQWKQVARPEVAFDFADAHGKLLNNISNIQERFAEPNKYRSSGSNAA